MGLEEVILKEVFEQGIEKGIGQEKQLVILWAYENGIVIVMIVKIVDLLLVWVEFVIVVYEKGDFLNEFE